MRCHPERPQGVEGPAVAFPVTPPGTKAGCPILATLLYLSQGWDTTTLAHPRLTFPHIPLPPCVVILSDRRESKDPRLPFQSLPQAPRLGAPSLRRFCICRKGGIPRPSLTPASPSHTTPLSPSVVIDRAKQQGICVSGATFSWLWVPQCAMYDCGCSCELRSAIISELPTTQTFPPRPAIRSEKPRSVPKKRHDCDDSREEGKNATYLKPSMLNLFVPYCIQAE